MRNYRTGLFKVIPFALDHFRGRFVIPRSEVGIVFSGPTCPVRVSFAGYITLLTPSPCTRLSRAPSIMGQSDSPSAFSLPSFQLARLTCTKPDLGFGLPPFPGFP